MLKEISLEAGTDLYYLIQDVKLYSELGSNS